MFKYAIVRKPSRSMTEGISEAELGLPNYDRAVIQHDDYIEALKNAALK
jgi:dimethylargininase